MHKLLPIIIFYVLISINIPNVIHAQEARLNIENKILPDHKVSGKLFGDFIEFLNHYVNSPRGMWAQELQDRSFDMYDTVTWDKSRFWFKFGKVENAKHKWQLSNDKYNENGKFSSQFKTDTDDEIGIYQWVYMNDSVNHQFYVYHKGTIDLDLFLELRDENDATLFSTKVGKNTIDWSKSEVSIPAIKGVHYAKLILSIRKKGKMLLDEASLMPVNNVHGIRYEFFKLYEGWQPGIIRYPGGSFADLPQNNLEFCIGPIDKRQSPNETWRHIIQRMDFGLNEFLWLCDTLNAEPHITLNFENSTPEAAANYVEYCNGDTNTYWGKLRKQNGHPLPYNVKYFEIGNEQWANDSIYANRYLEFYKAIKKVDPNIKAIIDGNHWIGKKNINNLFSVVEDNCQIYGYHPAFIANGTSLSKDTLFLFLSSAGNFYEFTFKQIGNWIKDKGYAKNMKQGLSEWWINYGTDDNWTLDTIKMNSSLESGITTASVMISTIKYSNTIELAARTQGIGLLRCAINPATNERSFFGTPSYHSLAMLSRHTGDFVMQSNIVSDSFHLDLTQDFKIEFDNQYIDGVVTKTEDSIYIALINRHLNNSINMIIRLDSIGIIADAVEYSLSSNNYTDANTQMQPYKIVSKRKDIHIFGGVMLAPHSFTIYALAISKILKMPILHDDEDIIYFPNPTLDYVNILLSNKLKEKVKIKMYDMLGKNIDLRDRINDTFLGYKILTTNLQEGLYFIHIFSDDFSKTLKIMKLEE